MRRGLLLLLLRAAADDRVVLRQDTAVPPWLVRVADLEALPQDRGADRARRGLQSSSDACGYVSVSGSTGQTYMHGLYEATGTCDSKPSYECLDCSSSGRKIWHHPYGYWFMGTDGCDSTASGIHINGTGHTGPSEFCATSIYAVTQGLSTGRSTNGTCPK